MGRWEDNLDEEFDGLIDDVRVYNRALTLTEVQQLANVTPPETIPPTVSITAPADGANVTGIIFVNATASDNVGIVGVQFFRCNKIQQKTEETEFKNPIII